MKKVLVSLAMCVFLGTVEAQTLRVVNAASQTAGAVTPGTIISIFGTKLATDVAFASDAQKPPTTLGGATVTIGATPAALIYTSPTQINAIVGPTTPAGVQTVTVASGTASQTGSLTIDPNAAPGLFSLFGTGTRDGAVLNAVTFALGDFSTRTANSPTYLALFATGLNTLTPTVTIGGVPVEVAFAGPAPCCAGLEQINVKLPDSLAGAGRVSVVLTANGHASNTVQVVLLPPANAQQFPNDQENHTRSRELAALAYVPNSSLVLSLDRNDDVVRVIDLQSRQVTKIVTLPEGAEPTGIAVNATGSLAVVTETGKNKAALIDLSTYTVTAEVAVGMGPVAVAIAGTQAVVVNGDDDTVSIIDLTAKTAKTVAVGRAPVGVAVDSANAYVTNESDGTVSVIALGTQTVSKTISLGADVRPEAIALGPTGTAFITAPAGGPDGSVILLNLAAGTTTTLKANPDRSGGSSDVAFYNSSLYFANQTGASVSVLPVDATGKQSGSIVTIKVDMGPRALAIDTKDKLLVVASEGSGTLVLVSLDSNTVVGRVNAVRTNMHGDDGDDDHSDRDAAANLPVVKSISPASGKVGTSVLVTITGTNLTGATGLVFINPSNMPGNGKGQGNSGNMNGAPEMSDSAFTVNILQVSPDGTQILATVAIASGAQTGQRVVRVKTPNGESTYAASTANTFTVTQ